MLTYTINQENSVSIYADGNTGHTGTVNDVSTLRFSKNGYVDSSLVYDNSNIYGLYYTYSGSNFTITPEVQYMYTPINWAFGTTQSSNDISAMIHADYYLTKTWSIATGVDYEHANSTGEGTAATGGYFGYGAGSSAIGVIITPTYVCAVQRHGLSAGANPARQLSLQPVAIGAAVQGVRLKSSSV